MWHHIHAGGRAAPEPGSKVSRHGSGHLSRPGSVVGQMSTARQQRMAVGLLVAVCVVWGSTFVVVKHAVESMPVMDFLAWRFAIAALAMFVLRPGAVRALSATARRRAVVLGLLLAAGYVAQTFGLERAPATVSGFITGLFVVFTPLCSGLLLHRRVSTMAWVAVGIATCGLALLSLRGLSVGTGEAITLLGAVSFALHIVGLGEWSTPADAYGLAVVQLSTVAVVSIVFAAPETLSPPPDAGAWGAVLLTSLAATA